MTFVSLKNLENNVLIYTTKFILDSVNIMHEKIMTNVIKWIKSKNIFEKDDKK
jgi:hypothetical protein